MRIALLSPVMKRGKPLTAAARGTRIDLSTSLIEICTSCHQGLLWFKSSESCVERVSHGHWTVLEAAFTAVHVMTVVEVCGPVETPDSDIVGTYW